MSEHTHTVCITRSGYITIQANTEKEALEIAAAKTEQDFDWEPVNRNLIETTATVVE